MHISHSFSPRRSAFAPIVVGITSLVAAGVLVAADPLGAAGGDDATFVPISPCRLFDTRPGDTNVGPRSTPLGEGETFEIQVVGSNGDCVIPPDATAIAVNATAVRATGTSYATFYPAGAERPLASSLNYAAGAAPTPNAIDVKLSDSGAMAVYNAFGEVHLLGDVTGYYSDRELARIDDEIGAKADAATVYTKAEVDALIGQATAEAYSKSEIDQLLADRGPWLATVAANGDEIGDGFLSVRLAAGIYRVTFDLSGLGIPGDRSPVFSVLPRCGNATAGETFLWKNVEAGDVTTVIIELNVRSTGGALLDCGVYVTMHMS